VYPHAFDIFETASLNALAQFCSEKNIVLIIVDTLASNLASISIKGHSSPENDPAVMSRMYDNLQAVCEAQKQGCSGFFLHHPAKPSGGNSADNSTNARGSGGIEASARFKLGVTVKKDKSRLLSLIINNEASDNDLPAIPFRLESVCVGITEDGDQKMSGVFQCGAVAKKGDSRLGQCLTAFAKVMNAEGEASKDVWKASVRTLYPDINDNGFKYNRNQAEKYGFVVGFGDKGKQGEYKSYRITPAGRDATPDAEAPSEED